MQPITTSGMQLMMEGAKALSIIEHNGIRIDMGYLNSKIKETDQKISEIENKLYQTNIWKIWKKRYGMLANIGSTVQLAEVFYNILGYKCEEYTATGKYKADESSLERIQDPFIKSYFRWKKLQKTSNTYLKGIYKEVVDGRLHPSFNLHLTETFRSSSDKPNFQNIPIRNPEMGKTIRACFIPDEDCYLVEIDYSGIEVKIAACYHKDPTMLTYINDKTTDMHRDMASQIFMLPTDKVSKEARHSAKNQFVFPQFYGSYFKECAAAIWENMIRYNLKIPNTEKTIKEHLAKKGIIKLGELIDGNTSPGTFLHHVKMIEKDFWKNRFRVYDKWKEKWYTNYLNKGYFDIYTGFRISGIFRKNQVINFPVQGAAFHCLLQSLIWIQKKIQKYKMRTKLIGQIHDSLIATVPKTEIQDYLELARYTMTERLPKTWQWICVPLEVEVDVAQDNWSNKKQWIKNEQWELKT